MKYKKSKHCNFFALRVWRKVILIWNEKILFVLYLKLFSFELYSFIMKWGIFHSGYVITHLLTISALIDVRSLHCTQLIQGEALQTKHISLAFMEGVTYTFHEVCYNGGRLRMQMVRLCRVRCWQFTVGKRGHNVEVRWCFAIGCSMSFFRKKELGLRTSTVTRWEFLIPRRISCFSCS